MTPKKSGGRVIGAHLTNAEQKALDIEMAKVFAEFDRKNSNEIDAIFLWYLHTKCGYGREKLKQAYFDLSPMIEALCERYEMFDKGDRVWLCTHLLKEYGVDIEELARELESREKQSPL